MKKPWQNVLNTFQPEAVPPIEEWRKEVLEELDSLSPTEEKYWKVIELLADKGEAEMYFLRKKYSSSPRKASAQAELESRAPDLRRCTDNYKRSLHENPNHKKRPW